MLISAFNLGHSIRDKMVGQGINTFDLIITQRIN